MTQQFAVIGTPIEHSLSPLIHNAIFEYEGRDAQMTAVDPKAPEALKGLLAEWLDSRTYQGCAVTAPYKPLAAHLLGTHSEVVKTLDAANTLTLPDDTDSWRIDNTDVAGFTHAVQELLSPLKYRTFVVFGTGATARTIIYALIQGGAATIQVVGRSIEKAEECTSIFSDHGDTDILVSTVPCGKHFDCAINATTLGLSAHDELVFPISWFEEYAAHVFDVMYRPTGTTRLINACRQREIPALDGRSMLYAQAVEQARLWGATSSSEELMRVIRVACEGDVL